MISSPEIKIEEKKTELAGIGKLEAMTGFLPTLDANYRQGQRDTTFSSSLYPSRSMIEDVKSVNFTQPIFNGFQTIMKVKEAGYRANSSNENLKIKKNNVALETITAYLNIAKLQKTTKMQEESMQMYEEVVKLADQRLSLSDISYSDLVEHEIANQKVFIEYSNNTQLLNENLIKFHELTNLEAKDIIDISIATKLDSSEILIEKAKDSNPNIKMS